MSRYLRHTLDLQSVSTRKISDETKMEIVKIGAEYCVKDGKRKIVRRNSQTILIIEHKRGKASE
jgi:hypothetical protein